MAMASNAMSFAQNDVNYSQPHFSSVQTDVDYSRPQFSSVQIDVDYSKGPAKKKQNPPQSTDTEVKTDVDHSAVAFSEFKSDIDYSAPPRARKSSTSSSPSASSAVTNPHFRFKVPAGHFMERPPAWKEVTRCQKCETAFTFFVRDHHCRNCGGHFCADCCHQEIPIPRLGYVARQVRVCDECFCVVSAENARLAQINDHSRQFEQPPPWEDSDRCMDCHREFAVFLRKHHCRHCGKPFCDSCSPHEVPIPKFGYFTRRVRVCTGCLGQLGTVSWT